MLWAVAVYVLMIFLPTYVQHPDTFNFSARQAFGASLIGNVLFVIGCVVFGSFPTASAGAGACSSAPTLLLLGVLPLFLWLKAEPTTTTLIVVLSIVCVLVSSFCGVAPAAVAGDLSDRGPLDRHLADLQRSVYGVRRVRADDPHLVPTLGRIAVRAGLVCDAGRCGRHDGDSFLGNSAIRGRFGYTGTRLPIHLESTAYPDAGEHGFSH